MQKVTFIVVVIMFGCLSPDCHYWIATDAIAHSLHAGKSTRRMWYDATRYALHGKAWWYHCFYHHSQYFTHSKLNMEPTKKKNIAISKCGTIPSLFLCHSGKWLGHGILLVSLVEEFVEDPPCPRHANVEGLP